MSIKKMLVLLGTLVIAAVVLAACGGQPGPEGPQGPEGPEGPPGPAAEAADITCTECHNETTVITGKKWSWEESLHGSGEAVARGLRADCAGCHSGGGFRDMVAAGLSPDQVESGDPNPTHQDCRTCHEIHTSYTAEDWALTTDAAVELYAFEGQTYDGGAGNLCGTCHQPRRAIESENGIVNWSSSHYGPHHGPQTAMLMGIGGAGEVEGSASAHYSMVEDTCVACHLGENDSHNFEPTITACQDCHPDIEDFDVNGLVTEVEGKLAELEEALKAKGMLDEEGHSVAAEYPEAEAYALWNYIFIAQEDESEGVHNPAYTKALLEASLEALK